MMTFTSHKFFTCLLILVMLSSGAVFGQPDTNVDEKVANILKKYRSDFSKGMLEKDPNLFHSYYADKIRLMPPFQKTILGRENAKLYHSIMLDRFTIQTFKRTEIEVLKLGTQILETGTFVLQLSPKKTDKVQRLEGKYLSLWESMANGELSLITEAWNYDQYYGDIHEAMRVEDVPSVHLAMEPNVPVNDNISFVLAAFNRLLDATVTQHDANIWSQYYCADGILMASNHTICQGKKSIDDYIRSHVTELPVFEELDIRNDRIDNLGTYIVEYGSHIASWKNGDSSGVSMGKNIRIWRREPDHSLKIFRSIAMYD